MFKKNNWLLITLLVLTLLIVSSIVFRFRQDIGTRFFLGALCPRCNVIVVTLDTLGAKHVGLYGYKRPTTPFLDRFAKERAIVFDQAIAQGSYTPTSHTSILTGRYPAEKGIFTTEDKLVGGTKTLAQAMKNSNYYTHAVSAAILIQPKWGWGQGFNSFEERWFVDSVTGSDAGATFTLAGDWIQENKSKPFFLFVNTNHLHSPHTPSKAALEKLGIKSGEKIADEREIVGPNLYSIGLTEEDVNLMRDYYDGEIRELDDVLSKFINKMDQLGLMKNTVIVFEGDHGEQFGEHGIVGWYGVYNQQIHVPLIVYIPGQKARRISPVVELRSIPATVLDLVGVKADKDFAGPSLVSLIKNEKTPERTALTMHTQTMEQNLGMVKALLGSSPSVWESMKDSPPPQVRKVGDIPKEIWYSVRSSQWHLIKNADGKLELYRIQKDPEEKENLIDQWYNLSIADRKSALTVFKALGADIPASCGPYCPK